MSRLDLHPNETTLWPFQKLQALQSHSVMKSNLGSLRDEEPEERLRQAQELWALKEKMEKKYWNKSCKRRCTCESERECCSVVSDSLPEYWNG